MLYVSGCEVWEKSKGKESKVKTGRKVSEKKVGRKMKLNSGNMELGLENFPF